MALMTSAVLLAPVHCVTSSSSCESGPCLDVTTCETLLGRAAPGPATWLVPPVLVALVLLRRVTTRPGRR